MKREGAKSEAFNNSTSVAAIVFLQHGALANIISTALTLADKVDFCFLSGGKTCLGQLNAKPFHHPVVFLTLHYSALCDGGFCLE